MKQKQVIDFDQRLEFTKRLKTGREIVQEAFEMLQQHFHAASYNRGWWHDPLTGLSLIPEDNSSPSDWASMNEERVRKAWFPYVIATKIALIHSETSELLEAARTGALDDKVPLPGVTAEAADIIIRVLDLFGCLQDVGLDAAGLQAHPEGQLRLALDLANAVLLKGQYNAIRADHALAARAKAGGKKY